MKNISKFQLIVLLVFAAFAVAGVIAFALSGSDSVQKVKLTVWATMPGNVFSEVMRATGLQESDEFEINYVKKEKKGFDVELLEALASGVGPVLFCLYSSSALKYLDRAYVVPFKSFSEKAFKSSFVEGSESFLTPGGIMAFPLLVDPMVMYWNRDIFTNASLLKPPEFWDELYDLVPRLTIKDGALNLRKSGVALGEYLNINNAFELLSTLIMQAGSPIVVRSGERLIPVLTEKMGLPVPPAERALGFYTDFSNTLKPFYSWNRSLPWSQNHFVGGDLGIYFGLSSELFDIRDKNPNLNFDVATIPQVREGNRRMTYGRVEAVAISRNSRKIGDALRLALVLSGEQFVWELSKITSLPPARRGLLSFKPGRAYMEVFYESTIIARSWLSPDKEKVSEIWREMIESVTGGRSRPREAVNRGNQELSVLLK